ncbi:MAG: bifunctional helix-turn-helix domain-containing protein/methylated-DNA--[protein]-cysteine S-methyltransferase, partial [Spirulinaceae cyanobacterium]
PDLATVAAQVHLSPHHFQRTFSQWAGISPKRFSQYLSVEYAKSRMVATKNVLDLSLETGLSSPGRLHDLFVKLEAMSPGEYKQGGAGLQIRYGIQKTRFGHCLIAMTERGICNVQFLDATMGEEAVRDRLAVAWPHAEIQYDPTATQEVGKRLFAPLETQPKPLTFHVKGTNFQIQVWRALLQIPFGGITTYQTLAGQIGRPTAARAVGNAVGKNPIAILIPCHRVLRESGELGGYRWGLERKAALVGWEASQSQSSKAILEPN